jgi:hemoglobin
LPTEPLLAVSRTEAATWWHPREIVRRAASTLAPAPKLLLRRSPVSTRDAPCWLTMPANKTMYERVGGAAFFKSLTVEFYRRVRRDPLLVRLYPEGEEGLESSRRHLEWFLIQFWGGPELYAERRGAPMLRMRHAPFPIGEPEREAWFRHMSAAVRAGNLAALDESQMLAYFERASLHLVNTAPEQQIAGSAAQTPTPQGLLPTPEGEPPTPQTGP